MNVKQLEPEGVDERLNLQHGEAQHHVCFPRSFVLTSIVPNPTGVLTFDGVLVALTP
jgi:hypothetical protein